LAEYNARSASEHGFGLTIASALKSFGKTTRQALNKSNELNDVVSVGSGW
jgi:hypothetical protein